MAASTEDVAVRLKLERQKQFKAGMDSSGRSVRGFGKEVDKTNRLTKSATNSAAKFRSGVAGLGKAAAASAAVGIGVLAAGVVKSVQGWSEHLAITRRTSAVIKSTGGAANVTAKQVGALSDSLERKTGVDGDAIQSGANLLLTFTNVRNGVGKNNKIFDQATSTVLNMSKALGQDTKGSAIQLGKALNDPIKGITALSRVGVSFTDQQKAQIQALVDSGKTMEAQKIILRELNKEFPRVKATPFERLQVTLRQLQDRIGQFLLPIFNKGVKALNKFVKEAQSGTGTGGKFVRIVKNIGSALNTYLIQPIAKAVAWIKKSNDRMTALIVGFGVLTAIVVGFGIAAAVAWVAALGPIPFIVAGIALVAAGLYYAYQRSKIFRNIVIGVGKAALATAKWVGNAAADIVKFIGGLPGKISKAASGMWNGLKSGLTSAINWIIDKINGLIRTYNDTLGRVPGVPNIGEIGHIGSDIVSANTAAGKGYQGIPQPRPRKLNSATAGASSAPVQNHFYVDGREVAFAVGNNVKRNAQRR